MLHGAAKLAGTTAVNMSASIAKDTAFAKLYGTGSSAAMPLASFGFFAGRDVLTIGSAFCMPKLVAASLVAAGAMDGTHATEAAQMVSPVAVQLVATPFHLAALNRFNYPTATVAERVSNVASLAPSTTAARMLRMAPAYGIGGVMNTYLTHSGRDALLKHYLPLGAPLDARRKRSRHAADPELEEGPDELGRNAMVGFLRYPNIALGRGDGPGGAGLMRKLSWLGMERPKKEE